MFVFHYSLIYLPVALGVLGLIFSGGGDRPTAAGWDADSPFFWAYLLFALANVRIVYRVRRCARQRKRPPCDNT